LKLGRSCLINTVDPLPWGDAMSFSQSEKTFEFKGGPSVIEEVAQQSRLADREFLCS
jgi:hypothetical protein